MNDNDRMIAAHQQRFVWATFSFCLVGRTQITGMFETPHDVSIFLWRVHACHIASGDAPRKLMNRGLHPTVRSGSSTSTMLQGKDGGVTRGRTWCLNGPIRPHECKDMQRGHALQRRDGMSTTGATCAPATSDPSEGPTEQAQARHHLLQSKNSTCQF